jgi:hypothetical protein
LKDAIKTWWDGKHVPHETSVHVVFLNGGKREWHWSAKVARGVSGFLMEHWQWSAGFALAAIGVWKH